MYLSFRKKKLYDTFSLSTVYATPTNGSAAGQKDVLYAYTNASVSTDDHTTYYSTVPIGEHLLLSVSKPAAERENSELRLPNGRRLSVLSATDLYYATTNVSQNSSIAKEDSDLEEQRAAAAEILGGSASCSPAADQLQVAQLELPPELLKLQQLPNGNIHLTLPCIRQPPARNRPAIPFRTNSARVPRVDNALKTGTLPRLPRRQPRQKKFNTMVGYMRKKISETTATLKVTRPERRKRPRIPTSVVGNRVAISAPIPPTSADSGRTSPTPTEILFSFDYDEEDVDENDSVDTPTCDIREEVCAQNFVRDSSVADCQPIYDFPPENMRKRPPALPSGENGYLKSPSACTETREDNENDVECNIYEEVRGRQVLTLKSSGFELAHTYC